MHSHMKIIQYCPAYRPSVGGLEFVVHTLGRELVQLGHSVRILTQQTGTWNDDAELGVIRAPSLSHQLMVIKWADAVISHQDTLGLAWPLALVRKPSLMMIHVTPQRRRGPARLLMSLIVKRCGMKAASRYLAGEVEELFGVPCGVLPNPYDSRHFYPFPHGEPRPIDIVFVGRLAMVKGVDIFVEALRDLAEQGVRPTVQIIGDGEERRGIEGLIMKHKLGGHVKLLGNLDGVQIGDTLRRAYCLVVPSRYEPFGIVALEGRACGCQLVVTETGGLPEAAGHSAVVVQRGNVKALAGGLARVLEQRKEGSKELRSEAPPLDGLETHRPSNVAKCYLAALQSLKHREA